MRAVCLMARSALCACDCMWVHLMRKFTCCWYARLERGRQSVCVVCVWECPPHSRPTHNTQYTIYTLTRAVCVCLYVCYIHSTWIVFQIVTGILQSLVDEPKRKYKLLKSLACGVLVCWPARVCKHRTHACAMRTLRVPATPASHQATTPSTSAPSASIAQFSTLLHSAALHFLVSMCVCDWKADAQASARARGP